VNFQTSNIKIVNLYHFSPSNLEQ